MIYALIACAVLLTIIFIVIRCLKGGFFALFTKTLASIAFVLVALISSYSKGLNLVFVFIILGLIFGLIGDVVLDLKVIYKQDNDVYLNAGFASFAIGHIMYFIAIILYSNSIFLADVKTFYLICAGIGIAGLVTLFIGLFGEKLLKLSFGKFKLQVIGYTFILSFMSAFSILVSTYISIFFIFAIGITLIFVSDLVLSLQYFGGKQNSKLLITLNHAIYYLGQIAIATSIFFI
ncbi:MAG: hypothetical protein E7376_00040 [Clostridiales bacterium]|nr:hypothetical protein [Clostridiales bacterium]